jgi:hypothetical protein
MGTHRTLLLLVLGLISASSAQQYASKLYKLEGNVVNSVDGKPVPRALVQLSGRAALTGPEGEFSFDGVPAGRIPVSVTKPGYFNPGSKMGGWPSGRIVDVGPGTGQIILKLSPEGVIFGSVTGKDDEPLEGTAIQVLTYVTIGGHRQLTSARGNVRTDEDGNFRVAGLVAGRYYVAVRTGNLSRRVLSAVTAEAREAYPAIVYYPGTTDLDAATPVDLAPGQHTETDFALALAPAFKFAGTVTASGEWKQVNPPMIVDELGQPLFTPAEFSPQSGAFQFHAVPAGTYVVRLGGIDMQDHYTFTRRRLTLSRPIGDARLSLQPGIDIPVIVRMEFNKTHPPGSCSYSGPDGELHQSDCSDYPAAHVDLIADDAMRSQFSTDYGPMKNPATFGLHGVPPGKYMVRAQPRFGGYVRSLSSGNVDLLRQELVVPENGSVSPIEVALRDDSASLRVHVSAEKPGQQSIVLIFPEDVLFAEPQMMSSTGNAEIQAGPLAPGRYRVFAFDSIDGLDYANPDVMARYESRSASVTVAANESASVSVDVIHNGD